MGVHPWWDYEVKKRACDNLLVESLIIDPCAPWRAYAKL